MPRYDLSQSAGPWISPPIPPASTATTAGPPCALRALTFSRICLQFAELIELGLMLQNLFDDVASVLERLQVCGGEGACERESVFQPRGTARMDGPSCVR